MSLHLYKSIKAKLNTQMGDDPKVSLMMKSKDHYDKQLGQLFDGYLDESKKMYKEDLNAVYQELNKFRDKEVYKAFTAESKYTPTSFASHEDVVKRLDSMAKAMEPAPKVAPQSEKYGKSGNENR